MRQLRDRQGERERGESTIPAPSKIDTQLKVVTDVVVVVVVASLFASFAELPTPTPTPTTIIRNTKSPAES